MLFRVHFGMFPCKTELPDSERTLQQLEHLIYRKMHAQTEERFEAQNGTSGCHHQAEDVAGVLCLLIHNALGCT